MPEPLEEIKNRILQIEDLIPWRQNEFPKFEKEIAALKKEAHELRQQMNLILEKNSAAIKEKVETKTETEENDEGGKNGFWGF